MLKRRDAQGLSITMIIVAVLGLIVLVVLLAIFGKESGRTTSILESCLARGGTCEFLADCIDGTRIPDICSDKDRKPRICCVKIER